MTKYKKNFLVALILVIVAIVLMLFKSNCPASLKVGQTKFHLECALTQADQEQGLSGRSSLPADKGMLFVFPQPGFYSFWMKDMNFPLDMIWFDQNKKVVYIVKDALPESYPATFTPPTEVKYVLEVNAGSADQAGVQIGDLASF